MMFKYKAQLSPNRYHHHPPIQLGNPQTSSRPCRPHPPAARVSKAPAMLDLRQQTRGSSYVYNYAPEKNNMERTINDGLGRCFSFSKWALSGASSWFWGVYHITVYPYLSVQCIYIYICIYYNWTRNDLLLEESTPKIENKQVPGT